MACFASVAMAGAMVVLAAAGSDPLVIGTGPTFPPYLIHDAETGALSGYDYEMMQDICTRIGQSCTWEVTTFDELIPGVMSGRFDIVLGGMAISAERLRQVDFSQAYTWGEGVDWFVGPEGAPAPEQALTAVVSGTIQENYLRDNGLDYRPYPSESDALRAVGSGKADLALGPFEAREDLAPLIQGQNLIYLFTAEVPDDGVGIAVCKGNTELLAQIDTALDAMFADGTMDALESRWH